MPSNNSKEYSSDNSIDENWTVLFLFDFSKPLLLHVDEAYINEPFNLYGIQDIVKDYDKCIKKIIEGTTKCKDTEKTVYYLIHQRYILTKIGLVQMAKNISDGVYGKCQRYRCRGSLLLPVGLSDLPHVSNTKLYCNQCKELYESSDELATIDGCAYGRSFMGIFMLMFEDMFVRKKEVAKYIPRVFGFKIETRHIERPSMMARKSSSKNKQ